MKLNESCGQTRMLCTRTGQVVIIQWYAISSTNYTTAGGSTSPRLITCGVVRVTILMQSMIGQTEAHKVQPTNRGND